MNHNKVTILFLLPVILLQSCGSKKDSLESDSTSKMRTSTVQIDGGSITKNIIINTNRIYYSANSKPKILSGAIEVKSNANSSYNLTQNDLILETIQKTKEENAKDLYKNTGSGNLFKPENYINLGVALGAGAAGILLAPELAIVGSAGLVFGGDALKGFAVVNQKNEIESGLKILNDRRDRDILLLSINEAKYAGDHFMDDLIVGTDPKVIKNKVFQYQNQIYKKTNLTPKEMELFLKNSNDNFLLGLALTIKDKQDLLKKDTSTIAKSLNKTNILIQDFKKSTTEFAQKQSLVLEEIRKNFNPDEQELIINALFDKSNTNKKEILFSPEQLTFFKNHPDKLNTFKKFLNNDASQLSTLQNIVEMQEGAQKAYAYLQVTTQIANNLNLNPEIAKALNSGASVASAVSSISSFMLTSNPMDALSAISTLSGLFSKPKPDPRFTAIFENFKSIQITLGNIQKQLISIDNKLDNMDIGLKYVILQNQALIDLNSERSNAPLFNCAEISEDLKNRTRAEGLNFYHLQSEFLNTRQAEVEKFNQCLNYLGETFKDSLVYKRVYFSDQINPERAESDSEYKNYYTTVNILNSTYSKLITFQSDTMKRNEIFSARNLLSTNTIISNVRQLLANSFLFDFVNYNRETHNWELVNYNQINESIKNNYKTELMLKDAIKLINVAIIQQSIIDGSTTNDRLLKAFWLTKNENCEDVQFASIPCLATLNSTLAKNLISATFDKLVTPKFYSAWKNIAPNNPDWINIKLGTNSIKVLWVGSGASHLFTGEIKPSIPGITDGAYIKIGNSPELFNLPSIESLDSNNLVKSNRVKLLLEYKTALENELVERQINQKLSTRDLEFYNQIKTNQVTL